MGGTVVDVLARLRADASGMKSGFGQAEAAAKGFSAKTVALGSAIGTALGQVATQAAMAAGRAVVGFVGDSVNAARDINETVSKVGVIFGDQAGAIEKFASNAATSLGLSKQAAMDGASTFAVFGKSAGLAGGDLTGFATELTGLSSDLASFYNTSPEEAITAIGAALRGESEPIRKYGILLDDASLRQQALSMGIVNTTKQALTPQQRVLAAQALILKQTSDAQGDFERTSGGLANQQRILAAQIENVKTSFGQALLPAVLAVTTAFTSKVIPAVQQAADWMSKNLGPAIEKAMGAFKGLFSTAGGGTSILTAMSGYVQGLGNAFKIYVKPAIESLMPKLMTLFTVIKENVLPAFMAIVGFLAKSVYPTLFKIYGGVLEIVGIFAEKLAPVIKATSNFIRTKLVPALTEIFKKAQPVIDTIIELGKDLATIAGSIIKFVMPIILKLAGFLITVLKPAFNVVITIIGVVLKVIGTLVKGIKNIGTVFSVAKDMAIGAFNLLMTGIGVVVNKIIDIFNGLIKAWNLVPFHDDVAEISHITMPQFGKSVATATKTATTGLKSVTTSAKKTKEATDKVTDATIKTTDATDANTAATEANAKAQEEARKKAIESAKAELDMFKARTSLNKAATDMGSFLKKGLYESLTGSDAKSAISDAMGKYGDLISGYSGTIADELEKTKFDLKGAQLTENLRDSLSGFESQLEGLSSQRESLTDEIKSATEALQTAKQSRADGAAALKDLMTGVFGEPSQLRTALSSAEASVSSIITTYNSMVDSINKRFAGITGGKKDELISFLQRQTEKLLDLARQRQQVAKKIEAAQQALADVLSARSSYVKSITDGIATYGRELKGLIDKENGVADPSSIVSSFQQRLEAIRNYTKNVSALAASGLDRGIIDQIIGMGVEEGGALAQSLIGATPEQIQALNAAQTEIASLADSFGGKMGDQYYSSAIQQAQAYLDGWTAEESAIQTKMNAIAASIEDQLSMLTDASRTVGTDAAQALLDGLKAKETALLAYAKSIGDQIAAAIATAIAAAEKAAAEFNAAQAIVTPTKTAAGYDATVFGAPLVPKIELTPEPTPPPTIVMPKDFLAGISGGDTAINKGAVSVVFNNYGTAMDKNAIDTAVVETEKAMEEALIKAAKQAANLRRMATT